MMPLVEPHDCPYQIIYDLTVLLRNLQILRLTLNRGCLTLLKCGQLPPHTFQKLVFCSPSTFQKITYFLRLFFGLKFVCINVIFKTIPSYIHGSLSLTRESPSGTESDQKDFLILHPPPPPILRLCRPCVSGLVKA